MCNIFESPMTLAVAKPPYHSPTCRPPPSRDTPHTHWTLLQRDLPIEHQRTYQPYSGPAHLFHTFSFLSGLDPPVPGPQSQRSASCPGRFPFFLLRPHPSGVVRFGEIHYRSTQSVVLDVNFSMLTTTYAIASTQRQAQNRFIEKFRVQIA